MLTVSFAYNGIKEDYNDKCDDLCESCNMHGKGWISCPLGSMPCPFIGNHESHRAIPCKYITSDNWKNIIKFSEE